ncbi:MAG: sugar phosphate isomerase/epimerase [Acidobacteriales bacterium]|nr:sugar phosphate isomerase/epimerase [Terriglobales bacterium]
MQILLAIALLAAPCARAADFPFFALCMDTHDAKKRNLQEQARMLRELGYDGAGHLWLAGLSERLATLDAAGLRLFQVYFSLNIDPAAKQAYDPELKQALPLLKGRDVMLAVLVTGGRPSDVTLDPRAVVLLREIAEMAQPNGVRVVLYPHVNNWLERVEDSIRLTRKIERPNVGVMFNLCHWLKLDDETHLRPLLQEAMPYLMAVSINGTDDGAAIKSGKGKWIQPLDSGSFQVSTVLRTLEDLGYRGPVGLQCYGIPGDARDHLARSMAAWRKLRAH